MSRLRSSLRFIACCSLVVKHAGHLCYETVKEIDGSAAELTLALEHLVALLVEGLLVGDELLGAKLEATVALLLVPIVDTGHLNRCATIGALYLYPIIDAGAVEHEEAVGEYEIFLSGHAKSGIGFVIGDKLRNDDVGLAETLVCPLVETLIGAGLAQEGGDGLLEIYTAIHYGDVALVVAALYLCPTCGDAEAYAEGENDSLHMFLSFLFLAKV